MSRRPPAIALVVACALPAVSWAGCDLAHFGRNAGETCNRSAATCVPTFVPKEIRAISKGAVLETIGLATNDGRATWRVLDLEHNEVLIIERYAGRRLGQAPKTDLATSSDYLSTVDPGPKQAIDHVRRYAISADKAAALACRVSNVGVGASPPVRKDTDVASRFYLLLGDSAYMSTSTGRLLGAPGDFGQAVDAVAKSQGAGHGSH